MCLEPDGWVRDRAAERHLSKRTGLSGGVQARVGGGRLRVEQEGRVRKFRSHVLEKVSAGSGIRQATCCMSQRPPGRHTWHASCEVLKLGAQQLAPCSVPAPVPLPSKRMISTLCLEKDRLD